MKRVKFDFELFFTNGGSIKGEDFRLDIQGNSITDKELSDYLINDMNLLMVGKTSIQNKEVINENHKSSPINSPQIPLFIDLSHTIEDGLVTYKGLPAPIICDYLSRDENNYEKGTSFQIGKIEMVANTGTYIDCPFHRFENGNDLSEIQIEDFTDLEAVVIRVPYTETLEITIDHLKNYDVRNRAVLIQTNWDEYWNTETYYDNHPYLTEEAALYLRECAVKLVGIDSHNIDDTRRKSRPVHTVLLGADILIVEHLCNMAHLPDSNFTFSAVPPKIKGFGTFPVRAMAKLAEIV